MKLPIIISLLLFAALQGILGAEPVQKARQGIAVSVDAGVVALGGIGTHANWYRNNLAFGAGFYRFPSTASFGGFDEKFSLFVDYIYAAQASWYFWPGEKKGFYLSMIYHYKKQTVTENSSGSSVALYSQLLGPEVGYEWNFFQGLFIAPRVGALYYVQSPQGSSHEPVTVGASQYDNPKHRNFDLYYTLSVGWNFDF